MRKTAVLRREETGSKSGKLSIRTELSSSFTNNKGESYEERNIS